MTIAVLQEVQHEITQILETRPQIKKEVQDELRKTLEEKPDFKNLDELIDWKIEVWEKQYEEDYRIQALFHCLDDDEIENFYDTIILNPYIPVVPFWNQILLLFLPGSTLYGGARGGGKTEASLIGALQYVEFPQWKAGIFRLTYPDLAVPGAIMDRAKDWIKDNKLLEDAGLSPHWNSSDKIFTFPSGSKIMFGHVQHEKDADKYQGSEFHLLILDEAVQFTEKKITKLKGSNRKQFNDPLPLRRWYTGNPGGISHDYFKERFVDGIGNFIDSKYEDNPYLDQESYERDVFSEIKDSDPILYRQWKLGDWNAIPEGKLFKRKWFTKRVYSLITEKITQWVRFWDLAATEEEDDNKKGGPDWTVGMLLGLGESGKVYLEDIVRFRYDPDKAEEEILLTAKKDAEKYGRENLKVRIEQEGGASAKYVMNTFAGKLPGFNFSGWSIPRKSKIDRARAYVSFVKHGFLKIKEGSDWIITFLNEISTFPTKGIHDDQVDAFSGGLNELFYGEEVEEQYPEDINPFKVFKARG
jgi:predicted phage terminase large subunit-like protein